MDFWNPREAAIRPCSSHRVLIPVSAELVTVVRRFSQTGIQDFLTLTLTEHSGLLYVGAREALFAFSVEALELQGVVRGGAVGGTQRGEGKDSGCGLCRLSLSPEVSFMSVGMICGFSQNGDRVSPMV